MSGRVKWVTTVDDLLQYGEVDQTDECWLWGGKLWSNGYGKIGPERAHRRMWEIVNGPIPTGLLVLHHCDVRNCVNPDDLFLGTQLDNMHDMIAKGRKVVVSGDDHAMKDPARRAAMSGDNHWSRKHPEQVARGDRHWSQTQPEHFNETFIAARDRALGRN